MRKIDCEHCAIRTQSVIKDLPIDQLDAFRATGMSSLYKARQVIFHEDTPAAGLYILCHGAVKLYQSDRFGRQHTLDIAAPGDVLGELPVDPESTYSTSAEALTDSQLCYLPRERLVEFIQKHPMTGVRLLEAFSKSVTIARKRVRALALKRAESRLAELLVQLADAAGEPMGNGNTRLTLGYSRREIAEMIGVSPETAIRLLGRLKSKHAITTRHRELIITDAEKLGRLANHDSINAQ
jgi:CRP-like cAMP-binding protein